MNHMVRRPPHKAAHHKPGKAGYGVTKQGAEETKKFNETISYVQGFRTTMPATGAVPVTVKLSSPGKFLLGIAIIPASGINADIGDMTVDLSVNGLNLLVGVAVLNTDPGFMQGRLYIPTPQPLQGDDNIVLTLSKQSGVGTPTVYTDVFYLPR